MPLPLAHFLQRVPTFSSAFGSFMGVTRYNNEE